MNESKIILIEGCRNTGKSYLIENSGISSYKFPFRTYFDEFLKTVTDTVGTGDKSTYHFSTSFDITLHSMSKLGLINGPLLIDRGFLSNLVLGVVQKRITDDDAHRYMDFLAQQGFLGSNVHVIYVYRKKAEGRTEYKDQWEYLDSEEVHLKYTEYMEYLLLKHGFVCFSLCNDFDDASLERFKLMIKN